jgi:hypothetical protein
LAFQIVVGWWIVQWGFPRLLRMVIVGMEDGARWAGCWSLRKAQRWWHGLGVALVLGSLLAGCQGISETTLQVMGCEQAALASGYCHMPKEVKR